MKYEIPLFTILALLAILDLSEKKMTVLADVVVEDVEVSRSKNVENNCANFKILTTTGSINGHAGGRRGRGSGEEA